MTPTCRIQFRSRAPRRRWRRRAGGILETILGATQVTLAGRILLGNRGHWGHRALRNYGGSQIVEAMGKVRAPTLIVHPDGEQVSESGRAQWTHLYRGAEWKLLQGDYHMALQRPRPGCGRDSRPPLPSPKRTDLHVCPPCVRDSRSAQR